MIPGRPGNLDRSLNEVADTKILHSFFVYSTNENAFIRFYFPSIPDKTVR